MAGGYHEDVTRGAVMEAERETWLISLPSFATGYVAPQPQESGK